MLEEIAWCCWLMVLGSWRGLREEEIVKLWEIIHLLWRRNGYFGSACSVANPNSSFQILIEAVLFFSPENYWKIQKNVCLIFLNIQQTSCSSSIMWTITYQNFSIHLFVFFHHLKPFQSAYFIIFHSLCFIFQAVFTFIFHFSHKTSFFPLQNMLNHWKMKTIIHLYKKQ